MPLAARRKESIEIEGMPALKSNQCAPPAFGAEPGPCSMRPRAITRLLLAGYRRTAGSEWCIGHGVGHLQQLQERRIVYKMMAERAFTQDLSRA
jgi:hypothetical protein